MIKINYLFVYLFILLIQIFQLLYPIKSVLFYIFQPFLLT